jgi:ribosomal-protein-alanine N-acetyltransferase
MMEQPTIITERLLLTPFEISDAINVQRLAGDREIANTTLNIPHPYEDGMAEKWISSHKKWFDNNKQAVFAIKFPSYELVGAIGLVLNIEHLRGELGYWIGKQFWNNGYCSEAAFAIIKFGFEQLQLNKIHSMHLTRNPASGKVLQKVGLKHEGTRRGHIIKWDIYEDIEEYGLLNKECNYIKTSK